MIEIEAKLRVADDTTFPALLQLLELPPFRLIASPEVERQRNTYLDTSERTLHAAGYSLRVRDLGHRRVATLKQSLGSRNGLFQRREWQLPVETVDLRSWPHSPLRAEVERALADAPVVPQFTIRTRRRHIYAVRRSTPVAELSLDEGTVTAGNRAVWFRELEVELLQDAPRPDFELLVALLRDRYCLSPETRSKASRGRALLARLPAPVSATPPLLRRA